jgi:hypothetical protein
MEGNKPKEVTKILSYTTAAGKATVTEVEQYNLTKLKNAEGKHK